ncbi:uncharacterized protein C8R40DRAFT_1082203 [Lentinula edodes]|uniref:uncharacterized protein n=1 Tax=Lentinula edodes TaxID=5353 RepID=UPI001E8E7DA8|nr:uncharacterized protein C8R40DRAFT_1082203 [Lentinula edodes]KAH7879527.1 hypothetical protein C8R40DRAFT_1082203 [Lentinula edodes]
MSCIIPHPSSWTQCGFPILPFFSQMMLYLALLSLDFNELAVQVCFITLAGYHWLLAGGKCPRRF